MIAPYRRCQIGRCRTEAVCGVGPAPVWVCELHLEQYLAALERCVAAAVAELGSCRVDDAVQPA